MPCQESDHAQEPQEGNEQAVASCKRTAKELLDDENAFDALCAEGERMLDTPTATELVDNAEAPDPATEQAGQLTVKVAGRPLFAAWETKNAAVEFLVMGTAKINIAALRKLLKRVDGRLISALTVQYPILASRAKRLLKDHNIAEKPSSTNMMDFIESSELEHIGSHLQIIKLVIETLLPLVEVLDEKGATARDIQAQLIAADSVLPRSVIFAWENNSEQLWLAYA